MKLAYKVLHGLYPKLMHVTCLAHGLSRVAEKVRVEFSNLNELIARVKLCFTLSHARIRQFKETCPGCVNIEYEISFLNKLVFYF